MPQHPKEDHGGGTVPVFMQIDVEMRERLRALAKANDRSMSAEMRRALGLYLSQAEKDAKGE